MISIPTITVLAGVNGAGKSSIAGEFAETSSDFYFNPDTIAYKIRALHPDIFETRFEIRHLHCFFGARFAGRLQKH